MDNNQNELTAFFIFTVGYNNSKKTKNAVSLDKLDKLIDAYLDKYGIDNKDKININRVLTLEQNEKTTSYRYIIKYSQAKRFIQQPDLLTAVDKEITIKFAKSLNLSHKINELNKIKLLFNDDSVNDELNPFSSLHTAIVTDVRDWSLIKRDAWLYGVVVGWSNNSLEQLAVKHNWSKYDVTRLQFLHSRFIEQKQQFEVKLNETKQLNR